MKVPIKKHPEFIVVVENDTASPLVYRCTSFSSAVKIYRRVCDVNGKFSAQIFMEVVGYGETI